MIVVLHRPDTIDDKHQRNCNDSSNGDDGDDDDDIDDKTTMTMTMTTIKMVTQLTNAPATVDHNQLLAPAVKISFWKHKIYKREPSYSHRNYEYRHVDICVLLQVSLSIFNIQGHLCQYTLHF